MSIADHVVRAARRDSAASYPAMCPICRQGNLFGISVCQRCDARRNRAMSPVAPVDRSAALCCTIVGRTDRGLVRGTNQDTIDVCAIGYPTGGVAYLGVVADGVGGAYGGEWASALAAAAIRNRIELGVSGGRAGDDTSCEQLLREAVRVANRQVYVASRAGGAQQAMGTTLTVALIVGERAHITSVGDSRAYLLRAGGGDAGRGLIAQLTADHSVAARLVEAGRITREQARTHPQRSLLYRTIGAAPTVEVDSVAVRVKPGDRILLCSDGLVEHVSDAELAHIALAQPEPDQACERLLALANRRGGSDNVSVVIAKIECAA
jgi:PPM family protein phosphatase